VAARLDDLARALIDALNAVVDERVRVFLEQNQRAARGYTQNDRPAWAPTKDTYLRAWRSLREEGQPGVRAVGRVRMMDEAASNRWVERAGAASIPRALATPQESEPKHLSIDEELWVELGARPKEWTREHGEDVLARYSMKYGMAEPEARALARVGAHFVPPHRRKRARAK
jgi:hypothetical protein